MRTVLTLAALGAALLASGPAFAWESINDPDKDGQCAFLQVFDTPGQTTFVVSQNQTQFDDGDEVSVIVYNSNWSLQAGEAVGDSISFASDDVKIGVKGTVAVENGVGMIVPHARLKTFAASNPRLVVIKKGDQVIGRLDFSDFSGVWGYFEKCRDAKVAARIARERQKTDDIPLDPFAKGDG